MGFRSPVPESSSLNKINFFAGLFSRKAHNLHNILTVSKVEIVSSEVVNLHDYLQLWKLRPNKIQGIDKF